jgi:hypothetical protein
VESMFHRLVHCFRPGASDNERENGRLQFLAVSLGMNLFLVPAGVVLILLGPWLFRHWLDAESRAAAHPHSPGSSSPGRSTRPQARPPGS